MANYQSVATMCEVTYDSDWYEDDRFITPYRYSLMRNDTESNSDTVSLTLPSYTYYEYLRSLYDCRSTALHRNPPGYPGYPPSGGSDRLPTRAPTWHEFGSERTSVQASREAAHSEPVKIRPTYPFPSLHLIQDPGFGLRKSPTHSISTKASVQGATSGDESDEEDFVDRSKEKLVWVDALNKWIPEHQLHPRPYLSFVGNPPVIEKQGLPKSARETPGGGDFIESQLCERYEQHMGRAISQPSPTSRQRANEKREEIRRRAQEIAEQRKQRKAYSTPLYTSLTERKQKARIRSSKAPASTPVSPVQEKPVKAPPPKEVWQQKEVLKPRLEERVAPVKKEISITLLSSKTEDAESKAAGDTPTPRDRGDKHVKFQPEQASKEKKGKKKKDEEERENNNNNSTSNASAENKLIETLEKQRIQQLAEEQRLLQEQKREKERLAREKEMQAQKERLEKEREKLQQLEKDPKKHGLMNSHKQPHANYYESTMNAAGAKRRKGKGEGTKTQKKKTSKPKKKSEEDEEEEEEKHQPEPTQEQEPVPVITPPTSAPNQSKSKYIEKKTKRGFNRVKGAPAKPDVKPMLAGMGTTPKSVPATSPLKRPSQSEEKLTISKAEDLIEEAPPKKERQLKQQYDEGFGIVTSEEQIPQERRKSVSQRVKEVKEKKERPCQKKEPKEEEEVKLPDLPPEVKKVQSWIYEKEDFTVESDVEEVKEEKEAPPVVGVQSFSADLNPELIEEEKKRSKETRRKSMINQLIKSETQAKKWKKPPKRDTSYDDELRRQMLAEERRKRQLEMLERIRNSKMNIREGEEDDESPHFEDYGFLAKYCIFTKGNIEMYRHAFDAVDDEQRGWLEGEEVMIGLRGVNSRLTEAEEEYLYRILELTGYKVTNGADFKMFSVLAALSQRISALDAWMRNLIGKMDFKMLEMKMFMCKKLWECNVDHETNKISLDQLVVDLRAGGVSFEHEMEVREKLSHLYALDLLDFLTYIPLFIMIHESVVQNPLDDTREK